MPFILLAHRCSPIGLTKTWRCNGFAEFAFFSVSPLLGASLAVAAMITALSTRVRREEIRNHRIKQA